MRIIFLDIDGVLNNICTGETFEGNIGIDQANLEALQKLVEESEKEEQTEIVLTSSWRIGNNRNGDELPGHYKYLTDRLSSVGLSVFDETPFFDDEDDGWGIDEKRGHEIVLWLNEHKDCISSYVVLDDILFRDFIELGITKHLVRTVRHSPQGGLREGHINAALEILSRKGQ